MKANVILFGAGALVASLVLVHLSAFASPAAAGMSCVVKGFEATVRQGPSTGLAVTGDLQLDIAPDGSLTGVLTPANGDTGILVAGQAAGRAINLAFDLGNDQGAEHYLFGVGTSWGTVQDCDSPMGGPFVGPHAGDSGDWIVGQGNDAQNAITSTNHAAAP